MTYPVHLFFSYSHKDETLREELEAHLSILKHQGLITGWHDRRIAPGNRWSEEIDRNLEAAKIVLLLVSADFLASEYCYKIEMLQALRKHDAGEACVIPIIVRPVDWSNTPIAELQALPRDAKPVTTWPSRDEAWVDVCKKIRQVCIELQQAHPEPDLPPHNAQEDSVPEPNPAAEPLPRLIERFLRRYDRVAV